MTKLNRGIVLTGILHGLILLPLGHGGIPLMALEVKTVGSIFSGEFSFSGGGGVYEASLPTSVVLSLFGHFILIAGLFLRIGLKKLLLAWTGIMLMIVSVINILVHAEFIWGFIFSISLPFFLAAVWLFVFLIKQYRNLKMEVK